MDFQGNKVPPGNEMRDIRHDSPMNVDGAYDDPSNQSNSSVETATEDSIGRRLSPQPPVSILAMRSHAILSSPIPISIPESTTNTEEASQHAKADIIRYVDEVMTLPLQARRGENRTRGARKLRITQDLVCFEDAVSRLQPGDKISCIEYVNASIIYEHNKTDKLGHNLIPYVPYPEADVAVLRQTYSLKPTPLAEVFEMAESLISWPVEFDVRLPLIRKLQLKDLALQCPWASRSWSDKMIMDFEQMWARLCRWHNGRFTKQHEDWVDPDLVNFEAGCLSSVDVEVASPGSEADDASEVVLSDVQASPEAMDVEVEDEKTVDEASDGLRYGSPTPGCEFCNKDRAYRPRCPDADDGTCEECNRRCSCGFLPSRIPRKDVK